MLARLLALGLIEREQSTSDKRKNFAVITKKGEQWLKNSRQEREESLALSIANRLTKSEKELVLKAMQALDKVTNNGQ